MATTIKSSETWTEIRKASEAGCNDNQLSEEHGVSRCSIRKKRQREQWMTPSRLKAEAEAQRVRTSMLQRNRLSPTERAGLPSPPVMPAEESIAARMNAGAEEVGAKLMEVILAKVRTLHRDPDSIADPKNLGDLSIMVNTTRKIAGLDKPDNQVAVALNFGAFWEAPGGAQQERPRVLSAIELT